MGDSGLERYGETLAPVLDLWKQPEWAYLRREMLAGSFNASNAVAAEYGASALLNPAGSGKLVVVEACGGLTTAAAQYKMGPALGANVLATLAFTNGGTPLDGRWGLATPPVALLYAGTDPVWGWSMPNAFVANLAAQMCDFQRSLPIVLQPGVAAVMEVGTVNVAAYWFWRWRERQAFPGELE